MRHESTSSSVTWALYLLSRYPSVQERLRKDVLTLDLDDSPSFDQLESLRYLHNVCREVVRYIPPGSPLKELLTIVSITLRQADKDDVVNGMKIPAGTRVFIVPGVTNLDERTWGPDAGKFNPDRWDNLPDEVTNYSFLTFLQGSRFHPMLTVGTRSCIGRRFAETEMKVLVAVLVGKFVFEEMVPGKLPEQETMLTTRPKGGLRLGVRKVEV
jgi:cytochrome P450